MTTTRMTFCEIINRPSFSREPVASFVDNHRPDGARIHYNRASLVSTLANEEGPVVPRR